MSRSGGGGAGLHAFARVSPSLHTHTHSAVHGPGVPEGEAPDDAFKFMAGANAVKDNANVTENSNAGTVADKSIRPCGTRIYSFRYSNIEFRYSNIWTMRMWQAKAAAPQVSVSVLMYE